MSHHFFTLKLEKSRNFLFVFLALTIFAFNFTFKTNLKAVDSDIVISSQNLTNKHNEIRRDYGLEPLKTSTVLSESATNKANAMLSSDCWSHYCPEGKSPWEFFDEAGYVYEFAGENLAEGFYNANLLMETWMNSETHRENILNSNYDEIGIGITSGNFQGNPANIIVAVHFGKRESVSNEPQITVTNPAEDEVIEGSDLLVEGNFYLLDDIRVNINDKISEQGEISGSSFRVTFNGVESGEYEVIASGADGFGNEVKSAGVNIQVENIPVSSPMVASAADQSGGVMITQISPDVKNAVNIAFIILISIIFLVDFVVLSRTTVLKEKRSFSHYHFILLLITGLAVSIGSFGGHVVSS